MIFADYVSVVIVVKANNNSDTINEITIRNNTYSRDCIVNLLFTTTKCSSWAIVSFYLFNNSLAVTLQPRLTKKKNYEIREWNERCAVLIFVVRGSISSSSSRVVE